MANKPIILVDGSSYLYRAFHAMPGLNNSEGQPTGAVYGVVNMLRSLLKQYDPDHMAVVFDASGKTFRNDLYPEYKANRPPMPEEMRSQIPWLHRIVEALGLPLLVIDGVEADDVIGTLARQATEQARDVLISTGDKDMAQLVNPHVTLVNTMSDSHTDEAGVVAKYGVPPERFIDFLTLTGDSSDNIPGVNKVGPKTAARLIQEYGDLDALLDHADEIGGALGDNLRAARDHLPLSRELVTIKCDVELPGGIAGLKRSPPDEECLRELYAALQFKTWLGELGGLDSVDRIERDYVTIYEESDLQQWLQRLQQAGEFAFDTETTDLDPMRARIVGVSFALAPGQAAYLPLAHRYPGAPAQLDPVTTLERLRPLLEDPALGKIGQNLKYDMQVLANHDIALHGIAHDTMLESYVLDSTASRHDLDTLAMKHLGHKTITYEEIAGKGRNQLHFDEIGIEQAAPYAAEDADITLQLHRKLWAGLSGLERQREVYTAIELPLVPVLATMERNGVRLDAAMLKQQSKELGEGMLATEEHAYKEAGHPFNLGSPAQIQEILFNELGLPVIKKTPKGQPSTAEGVLQELALEYELPRLILEYRSLSKLRSTYTEKLPLMINPETGRVHTSYHQAVAATGRLSSSDPNLQNIPVRTAEGRRIRQAFVPEPGCRLLAADYSQVELRIMAHLSGDEGLLEAFRQGADIHRTTAAEVFNTAAEAVTSEQRRAAKAINFGLIYGMSAFGLSQQLGIDRASAQQYVGLYFQRYPGVKRFMDDTRALAHEQGYVETVYGRRLYLPEINSGNAARRQYAERTAINAPMQGTAADLIKRAMISLHDWITTTAPTVRMIMQVHDELVFEVPEDETTAAAAEITRRMAAAGELSVPLVVEIGIGNNWDEAH